MSSVIAVVPDLELSVGVFTNAYFNERHVFESIFMVSALKLRALDELMGQPSVTGVRFSKRRSGSER